MRILTTLVALGVFFASAKLTMAESGSVQVVDEAHFVYARAEGCQREICVVFPSTNVKCSSLELWARGNSTGLLVLSDACTASSPATTNEPQAEDEDSQAVLRIKLAAAFKAGLEKLGGAG